VFSAIEGGESARTTHGPRKTFGSRGSRSHLTLERFESGPGPSGAISLLEPPLIPRHPLRSASMSRFRTADDYVSRSGFAHLPAIGDTVPELLQPEGSVTSSRVPGISARRASQLQEGDLVTGTIDITHERVYMLPMTREDHAEERKAMVCINLSLVDTRI
jgi:hypothetical protein